MSRHNFPKHKYHKLSKGQLMSCVLKVKHDATNLGDVTNTGNGERGTGNGSLGTSVQR